jgi:LPXTG-motif cell wall-anchored protein
MPSNKEEERKKKIMKKTELIKGHGFIRKTSIGLVCGIALGAVFLGANGASADEVTVPTTTAPTTAPTTATTNESKTVVVDEGLTEVANKAKEAGLTVNAEPTKNIGTANTEEETKKLDEQAKKEVAEQKAEIEKKADEFKAQSQAGGVKRQEVIDSLSNNPTLYNNTADGLRALADDAYNKGQTSYGEFTSSNGTVRYLSAPSEFNADKIDPTVAVLSSAVGTTPKEITMKYAGGNVFSSTKNSLANRSSLSVVPILVNDGETITYKVNVSSDSELGKLGVKTVERSLTLKGSPVGTGKVALLADRTGSVISNYIFGGLGKANQVMNSGKEFGVESTWNYLDSSGKAIDSKELTAKFVNAKWYPNLNIKANEIKLAPTTEEKPHSLHVGSDDNATLFDTFVNGGSKFVVGNRKYRLQTYGEKNIDPVQNLMSFGSDLVKAVNNNYATAPTAPTVNYHLVSYTVNKLKATNNAAKVKKGSIVQVFIEEGGKEIAPKTNTGEKPVDEAVKLTHPNEITFEGKTYTFTKQDKVDPTKIPDGTETITYIYKLKEAPKPVEKPTPKPTPTPTPVEKPTPVPAPVEKPTTIHIDGNTGKEIAPKEDGTKPFKTIDGYEPAPKDSKNVVNPKGETVRVYNVIKKGNVEVRYVKDDASRTVLKEPVADTVGGKVGSDYDTTDHKPATITKDGVTYELVRTEGVEKGKVVEGKTVVTYVYREVQKPITIHIDTEGNPVAPQEDGTKPFKEIEGYKPAPKDSKNVEDPKGVTVRVYDKVKPEIPQEAPKTPEKPEAPKPTAQAYVTKELPSTGSRTSVVLVMAGMGTMVAAGASLKKKKD